MPLRLSELLERIRPAGAPGAPSEGEQQRAASDRTREVADIADVLARFEEEADAVVADAAARADKIRRDAEAEVRQLRGAVPDRIAAVEASAPRGARERSESERAQVDAETAAEIARLENEAETKIPRLVAETTHLVLDTISAAGAEDGAPKTGAR